MRLRSARARDMPRCLYAYDSRSSTPGPLHRSITMVTPEVGEVAKARLRAAGSHVVPVDMITPANWKIAASWWETVFTKLQIFSLRNTSAGIVDQVRDSTARKRASARTRRYPI